MNKILFTILAFVFISLSQIFNLNANASNQTLYLTEIMANPEGPDSGNEWIEIYNPTNQDISLEGWTLKTTNKEYTFKELIIPKRSYEILRSKDFKITLKNTNEEITLLDPKKTTISKIHIAKATEKKSMSLLKIKSGKLEKTIWMEDIPSPKNPNSVFYEIQGEISENLIIGKNSQIIIDNKKITIPDNFDFNSLRKLLKKGDKIKALIKYQNNEIILKKIKLTEKLPSAKQDKTNPYYWLILPITLIAIFLLIIDKKETQDNKKILI
jgi:hypothetical protein